MTSIHVSRAGGDGRYRMLWNEVCWHHFRYASGSHAQIREITFPRFDKCKVGLDFQISEEVEKVGGSSGGQKSARLPY